MSVFRSSTAVARSFTRLGVGQYALQRRQLTSSTQPNHLVTLRDLSEQQIHRLLLSAASLKHSVRAGNTHQDKLLGKTLAVMFSKRSTRTRVATETAMAHLGGRSLFLGSQDIQLGVNETLYDTVHVLSTMVDGIMARVGPHSDIETLAKYARVPIINALSDQFHPTQILADLLTMHELAINDGQPDVAGTEQYTAHRLPPNKTLPGLRVAWVGDANNILQSMMVSMPKLGMHLSIATPSGYEVSEAVRDVAERDAKASGTDLFITNNPLEAVRDADYIVTDTWVSMGQEEEKAKRLHDFAGYQVTFDMARQGNAKSNWKFMHCLPRKQEEVNDEVFYSDRSVVFQEAENRKWTIMAVLDALLVRKSYD
ncbi:ornithine carbamoyltransferase [Syncephalis fuscata]|nr:ornithine carbamoyltransferase [Syncephalis fuscata]